ncbi:ABC transporter substrate-binding protein [Streptomyces boninensis]|uniref:ABC transporter substrate-binding protein n=1 Tax=Streptomyces boninensis TaxID=2039455 RepID=UPI003B21AFC4
MITYKRTTTALAISAASLLALSACGKAETGGGGSADSVTITVPSWVGAEANAEVAKYLLENELDVKNVKTQQMTETVAFDALNTGKADAILEDWGGVPKKVKQYVDKKKTVVRGGDLGVTGHIGWFVPKYFAEKHPDVLDYKNLDKYAKQLATSETGDKGQILEGDPSYTTYDDAIIKNLGLNFKTHYVGSEAGQITEIAKNVKAKKPFLTYWWEPQWMNEEWGLKEVKLPPFKEGCQDDEKAVKCGYPDTPLQKYLNADFAKDGGKAAEFLKNFKWTNEQQNEVAVMIAKDKMKPEDAAEKWVKANKSVWEKWIPKD